MALSYNLVYVFPGTLINQPDVGILDSCDCNSGLYPAGCILVPFDYSEFIVNSLFEPNPQEYFIRDSRVYSFADESTCTHTHSANIYDRRWGYHVGDRFALWAQFRKSPDSES